MQTHFIRFIFQLVLIFVSASCCFADDNVRILFLTDTHIEPGNSQERAMIKIAEETQRDKDTYDFAVITGDLTNAGSKAELLAAKKCYDVLGVKCYVIPGNHETCWSEDACRVITDLWGDDRFEFRHGDFYCIGFSTGPHMKMSNGHVKAEDIHWLDRKLEANTQDPKTKVLVFSHYPLNEGLGNWTDVTAVLKKYNVVAVFCGHGHRLVKFNFDSIPGFMGRPLLFRVTDPPGYNVIEITGEQLSLYPREYGKPQGEPFATMTMGDPDAVKGLKSDTPPATSGGQLPDGVTITIVREDGASIFGGAVIRDGHLAYGNSLGEVKYCKIGTDTNGKPVLEDRWKKTFKYSVYSTPVLFSDRVVVGTPNNELVALAVADGKQLWQIETPGPVSGDFLADGNDLYAGLGRDEFCKVDVRTGKKHWSYHGVDGRFQAAPALGYGTVVFGAWNEKLYALDAANGKEQWVWKSGRPGILYSPGNVVPVISESQVVIVAPDRFMTAIDRKTGKIIWRNNEFTVREAMGTSPDGRIAYAKTMNGHVIAVSAVSDQFELLWDCETGIEYDHVACPLLLQGAVIYHGSPKGDITALDATTGARLWTYKLGNSAVNRFSSNGNNRVWFTMIDGKIGYVETPTSQPNASEMSWQKTDWVPISRGIYAATGQADSPRLMRVYAIRIDTTAEGIEFFSTPKAEEDFAENVKETVRQTALQFLEQHNLQVAINANFYTPFSAETQRSPGPSSLRGLAVSQGHVVSKNEKNWHAFLVFKDKRVEIVDVQDDSDPSAEVETAVAGNRILVKDGTILPQTDEAVHPRTAVGISKDGRYVYFVVIDGRQPEYSGGTTYVETGQWLLQFGAWDGLNLDGGGSTTMVVRTQEEKVKVLNIPVGRGNVPNTLRYNGNALGVRAISLAL